MLRLEQDFCRKLLLCYDPYGSGDIRCILEACAINSWMQEVVQKALAKVPKQDRRDLYDIAKVRTYDANAIMIERTFNKPPPSSRLQIIRTIPHRA